MSESIQTICRTEATALASLLCRETANAGAVVSGRC
jgi:hypothetical protein